MTKTRKLTSFAAVAAVSALLSLGGTMLSTAAFADAHDHAAPIQTADMSALAANGMAEGGALLASGGTLVSTNAWCDPVTHVCDSHPWMHHDTRH